LTVPPSAPTESRRPTIRTLNRLTIRAALLLGFTVVFLLWLASVYFFTRGLAEIEELASTAHGHHDQGQELLLTVRAQVLLGSLYAREALDQTDPGVLLVYRQELRTIREEVDRALERYLPHVDLPLERDHWSRLQTELDDYWNTMLPVLTWQPTRMAATSATVLRTQLIPQRDIIIEISDRLRDLDEEAFRQEEERFDVMYRDARRRVWEMSGFAVLLGLGIATLATRYAGHLEARIWRQHSEAVENRRELQQLSAQLVRVQEDERRTIARELHDEIGQALTAIDVQVAIAQRHTRPSTPATRALGDARSMTERAIQTVRDLSELLHPSTLDDFGLPDTLGWYLEAFSERTGIRTELRQDHVDGRMPPEVELCAYRIIQEALTNVVRHARATSCRVSLHRLSPSLHLTIEDDGAGFDTAQALTGKRRRGLGLVGVRERVAELRGTLRLESDPGSGTRLTVELPCPPVPRERQEAEMPATHAAALEKA
jgi:signal transduction histidine kinase